MIGVQLKQDGNALVDLAREKGVLINCTAGTVICLVPPFVIGRAEIDRVAEVISGL